MAGLEDRRGLTTLIAAVATVGALGALARGFDFYFLRGFDYSQGIGAVRLANIVVVDDEGVGGRTLSAFGRALIGFATVAAMTITLRFESLPLGLRYWTAASFMLVLLGSILEGGRNTIAINALLIGSCMAIRRLRGLPAIPGGRFGRSLCLLLVAVMISYFSYVFIDRSDALGRNLDEAVDAFEHLFAVQFSEALRNSENGALRGVSLTIIGLVVYLTSGVSEMNWVIDWAASNRVGMGSYNFDLAVIALQKIGIDIQAFNKDELTRSGVYITAIGEVALDFGLVGTICICAALGGVMGYWWNRVRKRPSLGVEMMLAFGLAWIVASPMYSIVNGFFGVLVAIGVFSLARYFLKSRGMILATENQCRSI